MLGGLGQAVTGDSYYGWDGTGNAGYVAAIQNSANFGPSGTVNITVQNVTVNSTANLNAIQGLVVPWWGNSTPTQVNQIVAFFQSGGDLLLAQDDPANGPVGTALGITTNQYLSTGTTPWTAAGYFLNGPFGSLSSATITAYYSVASLTATGGTVGTTGVGNVPTTIYWPAHSFCSTCGALIVQGDVNTFTTGATFSPLNSNGIYALDMVAYLAQNTGNRTVSSSPAPTPAPPSFWLALAGLIASGLYFSYRQRRAA